MLFSSITFLFYFLPLFLLVYHASGATSWKNSILLVASLLFYTWGEPRFVPVMLLCIGLTYVSGRAIDASSGQRRTQWLVAGVAANLILLIAFKYAGFLAETANWFLQPTGVSLPVPRQVLPLGISFYVFQSISYLVDLHRRQAVPARSATTLALYISMFPQLVAGPIVRYGRVDRQLQARNATANRRSFGARLFMLGLAQKTLIADQVAPLADAVFGGLADGAPALGEAWLGLTAYTVQIYYDFAGYSNMAIGLGLILGFGFPRNFRFPYSARSVTDFWRRWHISLSSWFRDYVYIPLGGNRRGTLATYRNLTLVFLLCGIWHGASWNFAVWGLHHGVFLVLERSRMGSFVQRSGLLGTFYTLFVVMCGWVWFRAETMGDALTMFSALAGGVPTGTLSEATARASTPLALSALLMGAIFSQRPLRVRFRHVPGPFWKITGHAYVLALFVLSAGFVASGSFSPFLYFRF